MLLSCAATFHLWLCIFGWCGIVFSHPPSLHLEALVLTPHKYLISLGRTFEAYLSFWAHFCSVSFRFFSGIFADIVTLFLPICEAFSSSMYIVYLYLLPRIDSHISFSSFKTVQLYFFRSLFLVVQVFHDHRIICKVFLDFPQLINICSFGRWLYNRTVFSFASSEHTEHFHRHHSISRSDSSHFPTAH